MNYCAAEKFLEANGMHTVLTTEETARYERTETSGFHRFIQFVSHYYEELGPLRYLKSHIDEFEAVNHLYLVCQRLDSDKNKYFQKLLATLEIVQLRQTLSVVDLYDILLRFLLRFEAKNV